MVGLALGLATLTFLVPVAVMTLALAGLVSFAAGAKAIRQAHGLEPGSFSAGFYLATLLLLGAGGWQVVHLARSWLTQRAQRKQALQASQPEALAVAQPQGWRASLMQRPWLLIGAALILIDASLVRWEMHGSLNSPDGLLAAAILASMAWAMVILTVMGVWLTGRLLRTLLRSSQRSPYTAGLVTAFGLAISVASVLAIHDSFTETAEAASHQNVVTALEEASADSPIEQLRLALAAFGEPKKAKDEPPLVRDTLPGAPHRVEPVAGSKALPTEDAAAAAEAALAAAAFGDAAPTGGEVPPPPRPVDSAPVAAPPADIIPAAAAPTDSEPLFLGLKMGPPFANCVDRLTERKENVDPIEWQIRRLTGRFGISEHDARAIVLETLVSVCMSKAEDREDLSRYFMRSATNRAYTFVNRRTNQGRVCSIELVPVLDVPDESDGWHFAEQTEQRAQKAFCELSELDQAIIHARVIEDLKFSQIGEMIGLSEDGARKAFDRALRRMKENFHKN